MKGPDFIIVGAMKCGTSTLAAQLGAQTGIFMTDPKEPNFFSDDVNHEKGPAWYESLFSEAQRGDITGEASTHYTKLPTYPSCVERLTTALPRVKLIYIIRDPVERAISHFIHEWTMGTVPRDIEAAFSRHPEFVAYSCYGRQIEPYVRAYGAENICVICLEDMESAPQQTLEQVCAFLGYTRRPVWRQDLGRRNVSAERIRRLPLHDLLINHPLAKAMRRSLLPRFLRDRIKATRQIRDRPQLPATTVREMQDRFAIDRALLVRLFPDNRGLDRFSEAADRPVGKAGS